MPKVKTRRAAAKRLRVLKSGRVRRSRAAASHQMVNKAPKRRRRIRKNALVSAQDAGRMRRLLPNG
jgi:large subunit ribosomal protein L35